MVRNVILGLIFKNLFLKKSPVYDKSIGYVPTPHAYCSQLKYVNGNANNALMLLNLFLVPT